MYYCKYSVLTTARISRATSTEDSRTNIVKSTLSSMKTLILNYTSLITISKKMRYFLWPSCSPVSDLSKVQF